MFFNKNSKYDIKPEDNHPAKLYGVYLPEEEMPSNNYNIEPEDNIPAKIYGVYLPEDNYNVNNQEQNIKTNKENININLNILTTNLNITMSSYYLNLENHTFIKIVKNNAPSINDTEIPENIYNTYKQRLLKITAIWPLETSLKRLTKDNETKDWSLKIENNDFSLTYNTLKEVPSNWHEFMLLINDIVKNYDYITKNSKSNEDYKEMLTSLLETTNASNDLFWQNLYANYFLKEIKNPKEAYFNYKKLSQHPDINNEFSKYLVQKRYDYDNQITINGYNVKRIHEENPNFSSIEVYIYLCDLQDKDTKK